MVERRRNNNFSTTGVGYGTTKTVKTLLPPFYKRRKLPPHQATKPRALIARQGEMKTPTTQALLPRPTCREGEPRWIPPRIEGLSWEARAQRGQCRRQVEEGPREHPTCCPKNGICRHDGTPCGFTPWQKGDSVFSTLIEFKGCGR